jgi:hypothetical protein
MLGFSDRPMSVFQGEVYTEARLPVPAAIRLGEHTIPIHITY